MIRHVLKDGSEVSDITGYVIRIEDHEDLYKIIDGLNQKGGNIDAVVSASD